MDWVSGLAGVGILACVVISVVALVAAGSIRRGLNDGIQRQNQQFNRLIETVGALTAEHKAAQARIQQLADANRKLSEELAVLGERLDAGESGRTAGRPARLLH